MKHWEQIAFAVALAAFGWTLFVAHGKATPSATPAAPSLPIDQAPWYLTYNQTAGFTGPLATPGLSQADIVPVGNATIGQQFVNNGCSTCNLLPTVFS